MGKITEIEVSPDILIEVLSMAVLHCRREMEALGDDVYAVRQDIDEYHRLIRTMDMALVMLEAVGDFDSMQKCRISGDAESPNDGITLVLKRMEQK